MQLTELLDSEALVRLAWLLRLMFEENDRIVKMDCGLHSNLHAVWLTQRAQRHFQSQSAEVQASIEAFLGSDVLSTLVNVTLRFSIKRVNNRLVVQ